MDHGVTACHEFLECRGVFEIALHEGHAQRRKWSGPGGAADQGADGVPLLQQVLAQGGSDKARRAGNGDERFLDGQADATLRRTASAAVSSLSMSLLLMKSSRALARESLPEEVRGRE